MAPASEATTIRDARAGDHGAVAALVPELGTNDPPLSAERFEGEMLEHCVVAERRGVVVGYLCYEPLADSGYVRHLVVAPEARGAGVGRRLMQHVAGQLRERGALAWRLNVKPDNVPALALYRSLGMREQYRSTVLRFDWARVGDLPAAEPPPRPGVAAPGDDAAIETAFELPAGQLAHTRASGRVLGVLWDTRDDPVGFAAFSPSFPGAFPFRVARPALARALLEALAPHARPDLPRMQVVVEGDPPLADALLGIGAERIDVIAHLSGPLPDT